MIEDNKSNLVYSTFVENVPQCKTIDIQPNLKHVDESRNQGIIVKRKRADMNINSDQSENCYQRSKRVKSENTTEHYSVLDLHYPVVSTCISESDGEELEEQILCKYNDYNSLTNVSEISSRNTDENCVFRPPSLNNPRKRKQFWTKEMTSFLTLRRANPVYDTTAIE